MTVKLNFSESVPSWTKLGSAEFFRIFEYPEEMEKTILEKAKEYGVSWNKEDLSITSEDDDSVNNFLEYLASWYTKNKLLAISNYDLILKKDNKMEGSSTFEPTPRPNTYKYVPSNSSNIKPRGLKEIPLEKLKKSEIEVVEGIKKNGIANIPSKKIMSAKVYEKERFIEFSVIPISGKKGVCFSCSKYDYLMQAKATQYPLIVGLEHYANFYSYHTGQLGFCRTCAISNHLAYGRVLYNISNKFSFMAIPESSSILDLVYFMKIIDMSYPNATITKDLSNFPHIDELIMSKNNINFSNFLDNSTRGSGFYFLILTLFIALFNSVEALARDLKDAKEAENIKSNEIFNILLGNKAGAIKVENTLIGTVFKSWSFILTNDDQNIRHWRYPHSENIIKEISRIKKNCGIKNFLEIVQKLIYSSGSNIIDIRREDFSRSILMGKPEILLLEQAVWDIMASEKHRKIPYGIDRLATCLVGKRVGVKNMEENQILKECTRIGITIADLAIEDKSKSILYELRSIGNAQAFRSFIERFTFKCVSLGRQPTITNDFITKLFEGENWKEYKSIIAIVANQNYSYKLLKKEEELEQ